MAAQISELLIITSARQCLVHKKYRHDVVENAMDIFVGELEKSDNNVEPMIKHNKLRMYHIQRNDVYLVAVGSGEELTLLVLEYLTRLFGVLSDFCGLLNEDSIIENLLLIHEVLDEVMDFGCILTTTTEKIKPFVLGQPVLSKQHEKPTAGLFGLEQRVDPADVAGRTVIQSKTQKELRKNEVYIDVIEKINVLINADGSIGRTEVSGCVSMKAFLVPSGGGRLTLAFNEELQVSGDDYNATRGYGEMCRLDRVSIDQSYVDKSKLSSHKRLSITPPEGQFEVMTYHMFGELPKGLPFRLYSYVQSANSGVELGLKLQCTVPAGCHAINVTVSVPLPHSTTGLSQTLSGAVEEQKAELVSQQAGPQLRWTIRRMNPDSQAAASFKLLSASSQHLSAIGPAALDFEISGFAVSNLQIRTLMAHTGSDNFVPKSWIRYITTPSSYVFKIS